MSAGLEMRAGTPRPRGLISAEIDAACMSETPGGLRQGGWKEGRKVHARYSSGGCGLSRRHDDDDGHR